MKKTILSIALALLSMAAGAETRTSDEALNIARQFVEETPQLMHLSRVTPSLATSPVAHMGLKSAKVAAPAYYLCNIGDDACVVVSGDDRFKAVLGYATGAVTAETELPDGLQYWLTFLASEMNAAIEAGYQPSGITTALYGSNATQSVKPLLTTKWGQNSPYNNKVGGNATGCVATGMAQVMKFWNYPTKGTGSHKAAYAPGYEVNFGATTYDWKNMLDEYGTGWESKEEIDAVSTLMLHCGVATDMRWSKSESGTPNCFAAFALHTYFNYNKNLYVENRDQLSLGAWKALLIDQLQTGHPLCYAGMSTEAGGVGHFFVCDGYDAETGMFHFNWGWEGMYDGYFDVTALEPGTGGTGAGAGKFNYYQQAFINVQPTLVGDPQIRFNANKVSLSGTKDKVEVMTTQMSNDNTGNIKGSLGMLVYNTDGSLVKYAPSATTLPVAGFNIGSAFTVGYPYNVNLGSIANGTYTVCAAAWDDDRQIAQPIRAKYGNPTYYTMTVSGNSVSFTPQALEIDLSASDFKVLSTKENTVFQDMVATFQVTVKNNSAQAFNDEMAVNIKQSRSDKMTIKVPVQLAAGETQTITVSGIIPADKVNTGSCTANLQYGNNGKYDNIPGSSLSLTVEDKASAVDALQQVTDDQAPAFNLAGQRVDRNYRGIVVKKGKKILQ